MAPDFVIDMTAKVHEGLVAEYTRRIQHLSDFVIDMAYEGAISEGKARDVLGWPGDAIRDRMKDRHGVYTYSEREDVPLD
jgi:ABC-type antimicrobial peptide transport system ATPase subunit